MRILFFGDVVGRSGRDGLAAQLPEIKNRLAPDAIIVNAENATSGFGLTMKMAEEFFALGISCLTLGNHAWAQRELMLGIEHEPRIIRPLNYPQGTPGRGFFVLSLPDGRKLTIVNILTRLFMEPVLDDPFAAMQKFVGENVLSGKMPIFVDVHGEATSEKMALAHVLDGRVSAVIGTHTHVPTADEHILPKGTAYMSDAGMCGDFDSIIGMEKNVAIWRFTHKTPYPGKKAPGEGPATLCGVFVETDDATGLASRVEAVRVGGVLKPTGL